MKPEYLMLAKTYKNQYVGGWYASEKLDGVRAFWDGGISRGMPASTVPYANTIKDDRLLKPPIATGLWSRAGKVIHAPDDWLDQLPLMPLDGELYLGKKSFQALRRIVGQHVPYWANWQDVKYYTFDSPTWYAFCRPRDIKIRNEYTFSIPWAVVHWVFNHITDDTQKGFRESQPFHLAYEYLLSRCTGDVCFALRQVRLPMIDTKKVLDDTLEHLLLNEAEGVIIRNGSALWVPERTDALLKYKPWHDAEGTITGFTSGKGKYEGMIGALILNFNGKRLELSGLTDLERNFRAPADCQYACQYPGKDMPSYFRGLHFKIGDTVTFKYRELSDDGIPKEARYWRKS